MSSVFNLSNILSAFSSSQGINVQAAVAQALAAESGPMVQWQNQQAFLQAQTGDIQFIEGHLSTLQDSLNALNDPAGTLMSMLATSSNSNIVTASVAPGAAAGNHVVEVDSVATTGSWYSDAVASSSDPLPSGGFTLQVGSNAPIQITIGGDVSTMDQLAAYINGLGAGVTANVVHDASGARLAIMSNDSGAANDITISNVTGLGFTQATKGVDASLTVDGIPIDSASNTVSGVIPGVTFNLVSAVIGQKVNIAISQDSDKITQAVNDFVTAYNAVIGDVNKEFTVAANHAQGPLASDSTLRILQDMLLGTGSYSNGSSTISSLSSLGITMNDDGTLTVDNGVLGTAIQENFADVKTFFQGTASDGFAATFNNQLNTMTDATNGAFTVDLQSMNNEIKDLQDQIDNFQLYLQSEQARLTDEFNRADALLQQLPILEAQIKAQLSGLNGSGSGS